MPELAEHAVDLILEDRLDEAEKMLIAEDVEDKLLKAIGEVTLLNYLMKFEEYLDNRDVTIFKGWDPAELLARPKVDRFWVTFYFRFPADADLRGAKRLLNDKENQNEVWTKTDPADGTHIVKFKILRRLLDKIETENKEKAEEIADREAGQMMGAETP